MNRSKKGFWIFIFPALFAFTVVQVIPTLMGIGYSFTDWNGIGSEKKFVGLQNYITTVTDDPLFRQAFIFTFLFSICAVITINVIGFGLALLVTQKIKGANLLRGIFFMPNLIGGILLGLHGSSFLYRYSRQLERLLILPGCRDGLLIRRPDLSDFL